MEDLRKKKKQPNFKNKYLIQKITNFLLDYYKHIIVLIIIIFILFFPNIIGKVIGDWWFSFYNSFIN